MPSRQKKQALPSRTQQGKVLISATLALGIALSATTCASAATLTAQKNDPQATAATPQPSASSHHVAQANDVLKSTLSNGLRVVIIRDTLAPIVTTEINYLVGSDEAPKGFPGTAHATEHMMFRGSPGISQDQIAEIAANMGGAFNADTTQFMTQFFFTTPVQNLDVALHLESLRMKGLDATEAQWKDERGAIEQEVSRDLSNPDFKLYTQLSARMFKGTPYAHTPLGTRDSFNKTPASMIRDFHQKWYAPNNAVLVISGDVDPQQTLTMVRKHFGDIPRKTLPERPSFHFQPFTSYEQTLPTDTPYGTVALAYRWPGIHDKDYYAALILADVLGSQRGDLAALGFNGTALAAGFTANSLPEAGMAQAIGAFNRGDDPKPILAAIKKVLAQASAHGVDPALVKAAKQNTIASFEYQRNSISGLANLWSSLIVMNEVDSPEALIRNIEKVTPAQVNALARKLLDPAHAATLTLKPSSSGAATSSKGYGGAESFSSAPSKPVQLPEWARHSFEKLTVPHSTLSPVSYWLPNGIHLIVQPEKLSHTVLVSGSINTNEDMQAPAHQEGVNDILNALFSFGTEHYSRLQYQQAEDDLSANISLGNNFGLSSLTSNFATSMKLLAEGELHPALPPQAFSLIQRQYAGYYNGALQSPDFYFTQGLYGALLPKNDPYLRYPHPKQVMQMTLQDVRNYYNKVYRPDMTTITVIGDITPEKARQIVEENFGQWKANGPKPDVDYPAVPLNKGGSIHVPDNSATQDTVTLSEMVDMNNRNPDRYPLMVGNQVLSGGFYASRLYHDLRSTNGLVYTVDSGLNLDRHRGNFSINYGSDPQNVSKAQTLALRDLGQMQQTPISDVDLQRAKGMLIRQIPLAEGSYGDILEQLTGYAQEGKPLNESSIAAAHIMEVTPEQIRDAFKRYLRVNDFVRAVKGPTPQ